MSGEAVDDAAAILSRRLGLRLDGSTRGRLTRSLHDGAAASGEPVERYVARLDADPVVLQDLLDRLTVQETSFFRDPAHFEAVARHVIPTLQEGATIWCAGCANGQEAYSVAMLLDESPLRDWHVVATDISSRALARTRAARYSEREIRGLSPERIARHLRPVGPDWDVRPDLRARVEVRRLEIATDAPPVGRDCRLVFCRNVLIYLGRDGITSFLDRLHDHLRPGALLFLGASESLWHISSTFSLVRVGPAFAYRRPEAAIAVPVDPPVAERSGVPARRRPARRAAPAAEAPRRRTPVGLPEASDLMAAGEQAAARGDHQGAVDLFRQAAYVAPDRPLAHVQLGLALDSAGERDAARRAFRAGRATLARTAPSDVEAALDGWSAAELERLIYARVEEGS